MTDELLRTYHDGVEKLFRALSDEGYKFSVERSNLKRTYDIDAVLDAIFDRPYTSVQCALRGMGRVDVYNGKKGYFLHVSYMLEKYIKDAIRGYLSATQRGAVIRYEPGDRDMATYDPTTSVCVFDYGADDDATPLLVRPIPKAIRAQCQEKPQLLTAFVADAVRDTFKKHGPCIAEAWGMHLGEHAKLIGIASPPDMDQVTTLRVYRFHSQVTERDLHNEIL